MDQHNTVQVLNWIQFGNPDRQNVNVQVSGTKTTIGNQITYALSASIKDADLTPVVTEKGTLDVGIKLINLSNQMVMKHNIIVPLGSSGGRTSFTVTRNWDQVMIDTERCINNTTNLNPTYDKNTYNLEVV